MQCRLPAEPTLHFYKPFFMNNIFYKSFLSLILLLTCVSTQAYNRIAMLIDGPDPEKLGAPEERAAAALFDYYFPAENFLTPQTIRQKLCKETNWGTDFFDAIWIHIDREGINQHAIGALDVMDNIKYYDSEFYNADRYKEPNGNIYVNEAGNPQCVFYDNDVKELLKHFVNEGGNLYLSKHATVLLSNDFLCRVENQFSPNVFGAGERPNENNGGKGIFAINPWVSKDNEFAQDYTNHDIFSMNMNMMSNKDANIETHNDYTVIPLSNAKSVLDHNCMWDFGNEILRNNLDNRLNELNIDEETRNRINGSYLAKFEYVNDCRVMASWGQNTKGETGAYILFNSWQNKYFPVEEVTDNTEDLSSDAAQGNFTHLIPDLNYDSNEGNTEAEEDTESEEKEPKETPLYYGKGIIAANGNGGGDLVTKDGDSDDYSANVRQLHINTLYFLSDPQKVDGDFTTAIKTLAVSDSDSSNTITEIYNLNGLRMNSDNLTPGIYIMRQGNKVTKILIR